MVSDWSPAVISHGSSDSPVPVTLARIPARFWLIAAATASAVAFQASAGVVCTTPPAVSEIVRVPPDAVVETTLAGAVSSRCISEVALPFRSSPLLSEVTSSSVSPAIVQGAV